MRKAGQGNNLARLKILVLKVFSNDFATVDFREGLCYVLCGNKTNPPVRASFEYLAAHPHCNTSVYCNEDEPQSFPKSAPYGCVATASGGFVLLPHSSLPEKAKSGGEEHNSKNGKESESAEGKRKRRGKAAADPERISGDGSAPRRAFRRANVFPAIVILHSESKRLSGRFARGSVCAWSAPARGRSLKLSRGGPFRGFG